MSWREVEHTADWAIEVTAATLEALFLDAAAGFYALAGCELGDGQIVEELEVEGPDDEAVLVAFLEELLYFLDVRHVAFERIDVERDGEVLRFRAVGRPVVSIVKTIKAVTFHDLEIVTNAGELSVTIVFDV